MTTEVQKFPGFRYHPDGRSMVVRNPEQLAALGKEWRETPYPAQPAEEVQDKAVQDALDKQSGKFNKAYNKLQAENKELQDRFATLSQEHDALVDEHTKLVDSINNAKQAAVPSTGDADPKKEAPKK